MKIILYSNGYDAKNKKLDEYLLEFIGKKNPKFSYIPSQSDGSSQFFNKVKDYYSHYGFEQFHVIEADKRVTLKDLEEIMESSVLFLTGGNAFYYLKHLRMTGLIDLIKKFVSQGGILLAENAGANIVTPNIIASTIPHHKLDENKVELKDLKGLNLVDFEFVPHFDGSDNFTEELLNYSKLTEREIYAVKDYSGIVMNSGSFNYVGNITRFHKGEVQNL